ncbi:unnamed protein product, partial [Mesorhabditis belari]|uniref:Seven TM Receptor n=1 Tax=Mesorhabditis belari TaxID=2138241 RepID=A0AAF3FN57_9BILA
MITFALFDIVYSSSHPLSNPIMFTHRHAFIVFASGPLTGHWISLGYCALFFALSLTLLAGHFLYRYLLICKNNWMFIFNKLQFLPFLIVVWLSTGFAWVAFVHFGMTDFKETRDYTRVALRREFDMDADKVQMVGPLFFLDGPTNNLIIFWPAWFAMAGCFSILGSTFGMILFCSFEIHSKLKSCTMSEKSKRLQYELFKALIVQAVIPAIFEYTPCLVAFSSALFGIPLGRWTNICPTLLTFYTWLDPICIILCVKDYRMAIGKLLSGQTKISSHQETSYSIPRSRVDSYAKKEISKD